MLATLRWTARVEQGDGGNRGYALHLLLISYVCRAKLNFWRYSSSCVAKSSHTHQHTRTHTHIHMQADAHIRAQKRDWGSKNFWLANPKNKYGTLTLLLAAGRKTHSKLKYYIHRRSVWVYISRVFFLVLLNGAQQFLIDFLKFFSHTYCWPDYTRLHKTNVQHQPKRWNGKRTRNTTATEQNTTESNVNVTQRIQRADWTSRCAATERVGTESAQITELSRDGRSAIGRSDVRSVGRSVGRRQ